MKPVAVLFARADSVYKTMEGCDVFDEQRDARTWTGGAPVVAHPPCKRWSSLNNLVLVRYPHRAVEFAHGNDGGCFDLALQAVRDNGGVLEHPAQTRAWRKFDLPRPGRGAWQRGICGGWSIEIDQRLFGHIARKPTWLYAFGTDTPLSPPDVSLAPTDHTVRVYRVRRPDGTWERRDGNGSREISHAAADASPPLFATWLVDLARLCR